MKTSTIYALCEPGTRTVRYIGKTGDIKPIYRFNRHLKHSVTLDTHLGHWLKGVVAAGLKPNFVLLSTVPFIEGGDEERLFIAAARMLGLKLTNATEGGDGASPGNTNKLGYKESVATCEKKRKNMLGNTRLLGHRHSEEAKHRQSITQVGKILSPETKNKMSLAKTEYWALRLATPEGRAEDSASRSIRRKGKPWSPARRAAYLRSVA